MKKPTLRFRQVFEHPTHFKVTKPLGNPLIIAKQGLSPGLQSRLRKYAEGTPDEPVQPPTDEEMNLAEQMRNSILQAEGKQPGEGEFGVPAVNVEPTPTAPAVAPVAATMQPVGAPMPDLEIPEPPVKSFVGPPSLLADSITPPAATVAPSAEQPTVEQPAAETESAPAEAAAVETAPVAAEPTAQQRRDEMVKQYMAAFDAQEKQRQIDQQALAQKFAQINQQANDVALRSVSDARREYQKYQQELARLEAPKPTTAGDVFRTIGQAISVAMGAYASGLTGMPNYALKIYEDGLQRDINEQQRKRDSIIKRMESAGLSTDDATKMYRAQRDKEFASRMALAAGETANPKAREEAYKTASQLANKAILDEADIKKKTEEAFKNREQGKLAAAQAKVVEPKLQIEASEQARKIAKDRFDAINAVLDRASKENLTAQQIQAQIYGIDKRYAADMAELGQKRKETELPAGAEGMTEYDKLKTAFAAEGTKGLAKQVAQTFAVNGVPLLARSEANAEKQREFWHGYSSSEKNLNDLIKRVDQLSAWDTMVPNKRAAAVESLANKFAVSYPKTEGFNRALSVADKNLVTEGIIQRPTDLTSWLLGLSSEALKTLQQAMQEEKEDALFNAVVEGDPNLKKVIGPKTKEAKYGAMSPSQVAGQ